MPKGQYRREKTGASHVKSMERKCEWCGGKVFVSRRKTRAVCSEWSCQSKEEQRTSEIKSAYRRQQIKEGQKKREEAKKK